MRSVHAGLVTKLVIGGILGSGWWCLGGDVSGVAVSRAEAGRGNASYPFGPDGPTVGHLLSNLTVPRGAMVGAQFGEREVAFAGGAVQGSPKGTAPSRAIETFDVYRQLWSMNTLPHGRAGGSTTGGWLLELRVAFFGGGGTNVTDGTVDVLEFDTFTWSSLPTAMSHQFTACAGISGVIVCAGGQGSNKSDPQIPKATDVFTIDDKNKFSHNSEHMLSIPRKKLSAAAAGSLIVFGMGYSDAVGNYSAAFDAYDISTCEWSSGTLPSGVGRQYGTAVGCGGKVIFAGGQVAGGRSDAVDILSVGNGTAPSRWTTAKLSVARSNLAAACVKDRYAVFAGGQIPSSDVVDVMDTTTGDWGQLAPLNFGRGWLSGAAAGNCAVFAGGGKPKAGDSTVDVYCFS